MFAVAFSPGRAVVRADLNGLATAIAPFESPDVAGSYSSPSVVMVQALRHATPESLAEKVPHVDPATASVMASWVRLDNREQLGRALGWDAARTTMATDPELVLAAWEEWGTGCAARLEGDFAFAIWDPRTNSLFAARDALGVRPCYVAQTDDVVVVATTAAAFRHVHGIDVSPSPEWMALYLHNMSAQHDTTALRGVRHLLAGHWLLADAAGVRIERYHEFRDDSPWERKRDPAWLQTYSELVHEAVRVRLRTLGPVGVETSGGIDSSTVLALIAHLDPTRVPDIHTFGLVTAELEPDYILLTSEQYGIEQNHIFEGFSATGTAQRGIAALGYPVEHGNATGHIDFYDLARSVGVATLYSGHGGDEAVTQYANNARREFLAHHSYVHAWRTGHGSGPRRAATVVKSMLRPPLRINEPMTAALVGPLRWSVLRDDVFADVGVEGIVRLRAAHDGPFDSVNGFVLGDRLIDSFPTRTQECSIVAASFGLDYRWPLLDRRLIQQFLSTPTVWKHGEGMGRYLHRRALDGIVPAKVLWKRYKDMGEPIVRPRPDVSELAPIGAVVAGLPESLASLVDPEKVSRFAEEGADELAVRRTFDQLRKLASWLHDEPSPCG